MGLLVLAGLIILLLIDDNDFKLTTTSKTKTENDEKRNSKIRRNRTSSGTNHRLDTASTKPNGTSITTQENKEETKPDEAQPNPAGDSAGDNSSS